MRKQAPPTPKAITILLNGKPYPYGERSVAELLHYLGYPRDTPGVAVALNDCVVPRSGWTEQQLRAGDRVEIVHAIQGG